MSKKPWKSTWSLVIIPMYVHAHNIRFTYSTMYLHANMHRTTTLPLPLISPPPKSKQDHSQHEQQSTLLVFKTNHQNQHHHNQNRTKVNTTKITTTTINTLTIKTGPQSTQTTIDTNANHQNHHYHSHQHHTQTRPQSPAPHDQHEEQHLDLACVEIHGDDVVSPSHREHVGHLWQMSVLRVLCASFVSI